MRLLKINKWLFVVFLISALIILSFFSIKSRFAISNASLLKDENVLQFFKFREKLINSSYESNVRFASNLSRNPADFKLRKLTKNIINRYKIRNLFSFHEDILIDNCPLELNKPFYNEEANHPNLRIGCLKPYVEHLYFYNLKLKYKKNNLESFDNQLWFNKTYGKIINNLVSSPREGVDSIAFDKLPRKAELIFSWNLKDDNQSNYVFFNRQFLKKYEEDPMVTVFYKDKIILRNEYRIFCVDKNSGKTIWSFGDLGKTRQEFYQTFCHPHENSFGYELLFDRDMVFTELDHSLMGINIQNILTPQLAWKRDLGEYTLCTKPVGCGNIIIVGLINEKKELWVCGFNRINGNLEWNTYIGTSSFASSVCLISLTIGECSFIATNHGAIICLNSNTGEIIWLRKYSPRKYNIFDCKQFEIDKNAVTEKGLVSYDTQFLEIGENNELYYKPRESDYFYILNSKNGELKNQLMIDSQLYYILRACNGKIILLKIPDETSAKSLLEVIELKSGKCLFKRFVDGSKLKGVHYQSNNEIIFKIDEKLYFLRIAGGEVKLQDVDSSVQGWLLNASGQFLLIGNNHTLSCLDVLNQRYVKPELPYAEPNYSFSKEKLLDKDYMRSKEFKDAILRHMKTGNITLDEFVVMMQDNLPEMKNPSWRDFFNIFKKLYGDQIVTFKDVQLKVSNLLKELVLIDNPTEPDSVIKSGIEENGNKSYSVYGESLKLLPIKVIERHDPVDFYLLLDFDQLICVKENGNILWERKVFYNNRDYAYKRIIKPGTDVGLGRIFSPYLEAYVLGNNLILNDSVNIVAVDIRTGTYLWSFTNKMEVLNQMKRQFFEKSESFRQYGYHDSFLKNIMLRVNFCEGKLILTHGHKVYSINPTTGFCNKVIQLDINAVMQLYVYGKNIYILPLSLDEIIVLNDQLEINRIIPLGFVGNKTKWAELHFFEDAILLHAFSNLYVIDKDGRMIYEVKNDTSRHFFVETLQNSFLVIFPFKKIVSFHIAQGDIKVKWEYKPESPDKIIWRSSLRDSKFYFIHNGNILFIYKSKGVYLFNNIYLENGKLNWLTPLDRAGNLFYSLSASEIFNGKIYFIFSTGCNECNKDMENDMTIDGGGMILSSRIYGIDFLSGALERNEYLRSIIDQGPPALDLVQTNNYLIFLVFDKFLTAEVKQKNVPN